MNVLHINVNYLATTLHQLLIRTLENGEVHNTVIVPCSDKTSNIINPDSNVKILKCFRYYDRLFYWYKQNKIKKALNKYLVYSEYSVIHAHTLFTDGGVALWLNQKYGIPYIVTIRNTDINVFFKRMFLLRSHGRNIMSHASKIIFLSPVSRDFVLDKYVHADEYTYLKKNSIIMPNGIDCYWLENTPIKYSKQKDGKIRLIYVGSINKNKNIVTTIKACKLLEKSGYSIQYTVVGKVEDNFIFNYLKREKFVTYIPPQSKEQLLEIYRSNDIFVMPSYTETFGLVYAEALSQGIPVIYSKGQGFDGQFANGYIGYAVNSNDVQVISESILELYYRREELFSKCIEASQKFNWNILSELYIKTYKEICREDLH